MSVTICKLIDTNLRNIHTPKGPKPKRLQKPADTGQKGACVLFTQLQTQITAVRARVVVTTDDRSRLVGS